MKSPFCFIVKPLKGRRYNNTKKVAGIDLIISTSQEDFRFSNREAEVIQLPIDYKGPIGVGDTLLVHHNVFKYYNDIKGKQRSGKSFFKDDLFFVEDDQFYLYKNKNGWNSHDRYCFVLPVDVEDSYIYKPISEEPLVGIMKYPNDFLTSKGVRAGDKITFKPGSEYEFEVDGEKIYRMFDHQITIKL
jgi:hypothetical protein